MVVCRRIDINTQKCKSVNKMCNSLKRCFILNCACILRKTLYWTLTKPNKKHATRDPHFDASGLLKELTECDLSNPFLKTNFTKRLKVKIVKVMLTSRLGGQIQGTSEASPRELTNDDRLLRAVKCPKKPTP